MEINGRGNPLRWPRDTIYPQKLALTSPTSGGHSVGIVRLRVKATEFGFSLTIMWHFDRRSNATNWMFNAIARAWENSRQVHNAWAHFRVAFRKWVWTLFKRNCAVYRLLAYRLRLESVRAPCDMKRAALCPLRSNGRKICGRPSDSFLVLMHEQCYRLCIYLSFSFGKASKYARKNRVVFKDPVTTVEVGKVWPFYMCSNDVSLSEY
jgi:hypothetical protein